MSRLNELAKKLASFPGAVCLLTLANVVTFSRHYQGVAQFPWDFPMSYYGFVAYWTTAVSHGISPEWMPFEDMGYPFFANLQTGIAYPPLWFFPLTGVVYTMRAAVIFQVLHVLWGAIGAYALGRSRFSPLTALFLGMSYHFFGGFYGNAQHPDIIRAFAWLPWLLLSVQILPGQKTLAARNVAIPLVVMCVVTGSYPGNIASHLLVAGVTVLGALLVTPRPPLRLVASVLALMIVGIVLAAPMLGPGMALKHTLVRSVHQHPGEMPWTASQWPFLVLPWHVIWMRGADLAMVVSFVPLPSLILLFLLRRDTARALAPWLCALVTALVMLPGNFSRIAHALYKAVPFLGLSRFPSSDYRGVLVLSMLVLAAGSLEALFARPEGARELVRRRAFVPVLIVFLLLTGQAGIRVFWADLLVVALMFAGSLALVSRALGEARTQATGALALTVLVTLSAGAVLTRSEATWYTTTLRARYERRIGYFPDDTLPVGSRLDHPPTSRPARHDTPNVYDFSWRGYLEGSYELRDTDAPVFLGGAAIHHDPELFAYMSAPWRAVTLPSGIARETEACTALHARLREREDSPVRSLRYSANREAIAVRLDEPALLVENETYFPGWQGTIVARGRARTTVTATEVCGALRAWSLPAGRYVLQTRYVTPRLRESLRVFAVVAAGYVLFVAVMAIRARRVSA